MAQLTAELTGLEKATVLLNALGAAKSAEVLKCLDQAERDLLGAQIERMRPVRLVTRQRVLDEVAEILKNPPAQSQASDEPLRWMERLEPAEVADLLARERPHNIALVVSHLSPAGAARVISQLEERVRGQVVERLATMGPVSDAVIESVDRLMRELADKRSGKSGAIPTSSAAVLRALSSATRKARESVASAISRNEPAIERVSAVLTCVEDLVLLSDVELEAALREIHPDDLRLVVCMASEDFRDAVMRNATSAVLDSIRDALDGALQAKVSEIDAAQRRVMGVLSSMARAGRLGGFQVAEDEGVE